MSEKMFKEIKNFNILLVGDFFLDEYLYGIIERTSPEAPVPILKVLRKTYNLGGAGNVLNNLTNIGCKVTVFGNIADTEVLIHSFFDYYRLNPNREFFKVKLSEAIKHIEILIQKDYTELLSHDSCPWIYVAHSLSILRC